MLDVLYLLTLFFLSFFLPRLRTTPSSGLYNNVQEQVGQCLFLPSWLDVCMPRFLLLSLLSHRRSHALTSYSDESQITTTRLKSWKMYSLHLSADGPFPRDLFSTKLSRARLGNRKFSLHLTIIRSSSSICFVPNPKALIRG
ncbi:hypothetical protein F4860DRAFT_136585 [Xylaria cubensis]|nr:hypothetical protein F4860DRAFT_136585 [Xylaria cubensis]